MDATIQAELLQQLPEIDPAFLREHRELLLREIGAVPGVDAVRAVVVRHLGAIEADAGAREGHLQRAAAALRAYPDGVAAGDPLGLMNRHPAWVGLCHLEVADALGGEPRAALEVAVEHARVGFAATSRAEVREGEVLWAMAEAAEEVGWEDRADELFELAAGARFSDPVARDQVRLLLGTRRAAEDPAFARELLAPVAEDDGNPHPLRVQASFALSRVAEASGDASGARRWLESALSLAEDAEDSRVAEVLREELARLA